MESKHKMLRNVAYLCQGLAWIGAILWILNAIISDIRANIFVRAVML